MAACEMCGVPLGITNSAIGTNKCAGCARGTSPAAMQKRDTDLLARHPHITEQEILERPFANALPRLVLGGIVAEAIAFAGQIFVDESRNSSGTFVIVIAVAVGYAVGGIAACLGAHPLDVLRWRRFAPPLMICAAAGYLVGAFARDFPFFVIGIGAGLLVAPIVAAASDGSSRARLIGLLRMMRGGLPQHPPAAGYPPAPYIAPSSPRHSPAPPAPPAWSPPHAAAPSWSPPHAAPYPGSPYHASPPAYPPHTTPEMPRAASYAPPPQMDPQTELDAMLQRGAISMDDYLQRVQRLRR